MMLANYLASICFVIPNDPDVRMGGAGAGPIHKCGVSRVYAKILDCSITGPLYI